MSDRKLRFIAACVIAIPFFIGFATGAHAVNELIDQGALTGLTGPQIVLLYIIAGLSYSVWPLFWLFILVFIVCIVAVLMKRRDANNTPEERE